MQFSGSITSKLPHVGTTIFTIMSALANEYKAVNLSQGFPDFPVAQELIDLIHQKMSNGMNQYAPMSGVPALRQVIADKVERLYGTQYDPELEINITSGGTQALTTTFLSTLRDGDEVIIFTPCYDSYAPMVELAGAVPVYVQLKFPDYKIDWDEVKQRINHRTRMIVVNTPNNPTGTLLDNEDMLTLQALVKDTDIIVLSDEVYEHIIFDDHPHESVMRYPELASRSFVVFSFGKTFHATGWKMGYVMAPENLMKEFRKVHQYEVFSSNAPIQYALAEYMKNQEVFNISGMYQAKRDYFLEKIKGSKFEPLPSLGTYFQLLKYDQITDEPDTDFAIRLTKEIGVAAIPISVFYHIPTDHKVLRFCFAKQDETLDKAGEILRSI